VSVLDFVREQEDEERLERLVYGPESVVSGQPGDSREKERLRILWSVLAPLCRAHVMATDSPTQVFIQLRASNDRATAVPTLWP
jgi:hypothetical protein